MKIVGIELVVAVIWMFSLICEGFPHFEFNLCGYMIAGGTCQGACKYEARHKWGINLCAHNTSDSNKCCIPLDHPLVKAKEEAEAAAAAATTSTTSTTLSTTTQPETTSTITITTTAAETTTATSLETAQKNCGYSKPHSRVRRLVGGKHAMPGAWGWQVALRLYTGHYICGGVVISDKWILTAAHCVQPYQKDLSFIRVFVGDQKLSYDESGATKSKAIQQVIVHEKFEDNVEDNVTDINTDNIQTIRPQFHDMALIELQEPLTFSLNIQPICLPDGDEEDTENNNDVTSSDKIDYSDCWVTGWGEHSDSDTEHVQRMKEMHGQIVDHEKCGKHLGTNLTDDVICFSSQERGGPCKGDYGSGVSCRRADGRYSLVGVISWGSDDCGHKHPSVLTKVQNYRYWINTHSLSNGNV